jgi:hypothetical protein
MSYKAIKKLIILLVISSCGFHPIYQIDNKISGQNTYSEELASIQVQVERGRINQELKNNLDHVLNPNDLKVDAKYLLIVTLEKTLSSTFINVTGSSGRNKVTLTAKYRLKDLKSGEIIASSLTTANDDFNIGDKRFADYIAEEALGSNLTIIIAQNIRNLLINDVVNNYRTKEDIEDKSNKEDE